MSYYATEFEHTCDICGKVQLHDECGHLRREEKRVRKALLQSSSKNTVDNKRTPA